MNFNKKIITILLLCICSNIFGQYPEYIRDSLMNQLKRYDFEPNYQIAIDTKNSYDILVNDYLVEYNYGTYKQWRSFFINWGILKSGKQTLQIKLYPEFADGVLTSSLKNEDYLTLTVSYFTWNRDYGMDNETDVLHYDLPKQDKNGNPINYNGKKELIIDLEFEAKVPYELKGWIEGIVFDQKDSIKLKHKLVDIYKEEMDDFKNKRFDKMKARALYHDYEMTQCIYKDKEDFQNGYDQTQEENEEFMPLENYELYFYGNGRLITLRRIDNKYKGDSPYMLTYTSERGEKRIQSYEMFFYQPKGSEELVLIR